MATPLSKRGMTPVQMEAQFTQAMRLLWELQDQPGFNRAVDPANGGAYTLPVSFEEFLMQLGEGVRFLPLRHCSRGPYASLKWALSISGGDGGRGLPARVTLHDSEAAATWALLSYVCENGGAEQYEAAHPGEEDRDDEAMISEYMEEARESYTIGTVIEQGR